MEKSVGFLDHIAGFWKKKDSKAVTKNSKLYVGRSVKDESSKTEDFDGMSMLAEQNLEVSDKTKQDIMGSRESVSAHRNSETGPSKVAVGNCSRSEMEIHENVNGSGATCHNADADENIVDSIPKKEEIIVENGKDDKGVTRDAEKPDEWIVNNEVKCSKSGAEEKKNRSKGKGERFSVVTDGEMVKKTRRKSTAGKESSNNNNRIQDTFRRGSLAPSLSSFTNIHDKIEALTRDNTQSDLTRTQLKIHRLDDKILLIGKDRGEKQIPKLPSRAPTQIGPVLRSKILKFGKPSMDEKMPKMNHRPEVKEKKENAPTFNGYSVKNIQVNATKETAMQEIDSDNDTSVATLSGSVKLTLENLADDVELHTTSASKQNSDVALVTNRTCVLTESTEHFFERTEEVRDARKSSEAKLDGAVDLLRDKMKANIASPVVMYSSKGEVLLANGDLPSKVVVPVYRFEKQGNAPVPEVESHGVSKPMRFLPLEEDESLGGGSESVSRERSPFSPLSNVSDASYDHFIPLCDLLSEKQRTPIRSSSIPRRIFPQFSSRLSCDPDEGDREASPVIIDAGLSFDLVRSTSVRQQFKPTPAFAAERTASNLLSSKIAEFLGRTDHVMEEWKRIGKSDVKDIQALVELPSRVYPRVKSKSATNIMIRGMLNLAKQQSETARSRPSSRNHSASACDDDDDELNEINTDLSEERATGTLQAERLEAETAERVRLEQELSHVQQEKKNLLHTSERLEMELFYARADVNGLSEGEGDAEDGGGDVAMYKHKCERAMRELEFTRRRLQQQHEDDLEQLVALKKQLEKKLADAYEEVEEQRQVAGQWKRKVQKFQSEMNDLRLLLEEQSSRNNLLEKKQRKFDSEIQLLQDELRSEKNQKDRLSREKDIAYAEKYTMEQNLSSIRLELELKEEKLTALMREVDELTRGGGSEQEVTQLRKAKHDLELKLKEQEEELDELAGQVSMLESTKLRLEMSLESLRKEHRREMTQREDELDEVRSNSQKKLKGLEAQLENEHEERTLLLREKHELERRLNDAEERGRHNRAADEDALLRLRRDLKKTKALLRDAQMMLERAKQDSPSKAALRALKNQLEDAELARASAVKAKQSLESELNEVNGQLEEALRAKSDVENRYQTAQRECNGLRTQVDENEEELAELLKKYRQTVQLLSAEQLASQETAGALAEAEAERASLRDQLAELTAKLEASTMLSPVSGMTQKRLEIRIKELESRLELEQTTRSRLEVQIARLKENVERLSEECIQARNKEQTANDLTRKLQRSLREAKEELAQQQAKEQEAAHKKKELEKRLETAEQEAMTARTDLRLAVKRIEDLQIAMSGEIASDSDRSESELEEDSGDESLMLHLQSSLSSSRASKTPDLSPR